MYVPLKVAVVDSGINAAHSHVGKVAGGVSFVHGNPALDPPWADAIGHGTAVAGAICDKGTQIELYAVKIFDRSFSTQIEAVVRALTWCRDQEIDVVNLSLATAKAGHAQQLEEPSRQARILIAPYEFAGLPAFPGSFPWVFGVSPDFQCPRDSFRKTGGEHPRFLASPLPRAIPGLTSEQNFSGPSFAVANFTGLVCRILIKKNIRTAEELRKEL